MKISQTWLRLSPRKGRGLAVATSLCNDYHSRQLHANYYGNRIEEKKHKNMQSSIDVLFTPPKGMTNKHIRTRIPHAMMLFPSVQFPFHGVSLKDQEELIQSEMAHGTIRVDSSCSETPQDSKGEWLAWPFVYQRVGIRLCAFLIGGRIALTHIYDAFWIDHHSDSDDSFYFPLSPNLTTAAFTSIYTFTSRIILKQDSTVQSVPSSKLRLLPPPPTRPPSQQNQACRRTCFLGSSQLPGWSSPY